tara:strand:+ start:887 stop:2647 length:1761 start_codon:yes stop_codon:yes gene_type:complete
MLDAIFGRTKTSPTTTVRTVSKLPEEIAPYVKEVLKEAQAQYAKDKEEPYLPYEGETIAPRDQLELQAIERQKGLVGIQDPRREEAETLIRGLPTEFTAETAKKFMSPYQQAVVDVQKRKAQEDFEQRILPAFETEAISAGGLSGLGSRAGVQAALLGQGQAERLGDIQAIGSQKAYEDAFRQFTIADQLGRQRAADIQKFGLDEFNVGLTEAGLLQDLGQAERAESQRLLDKEFSDYLEEKEFPKQALAQYSSFVYGNPFLRTPDTTKTTMGPAGSRTGQLLSAGLTGLQLYGMGGGGTKGGFSLGNLGRSFGKMFGLGATGGNVGGLVGLPVVRKSLGGGNLSQLINRQRQLIDEQGLEDEMAGGGSAPIQNVLFNQKQKSTFDLGLGSLIETAKAQREAIARGKEARQAAIKKQKDALARATRIEAFDAARKAALETGGILPTLDAFLGKSIKGKSAADVAISEKEAAAAKQDIADMSTSIASQSALLKARAEVAKARRKGLLDAKDAASIIKDLEPILTKGDVGALEAFAKKYPQMYSILRPLIQGRQAVAGMRLGGGGPQPIKKLVPKVTVTQSSPKAQSK